VLHAFLIKNRRELIDRCRQKVSRRSPHSGHDKLDHGIPQFLDQLLQTLHADIMSKSADSLKISGPRASTTSEIAITAGKHGEELLEQGFSIGQVVHDYGDLCQAVTELAIETKTSIGAGDFHTLNRCLDNAIAQAVTAYAGKWGPPIPGRPLHQQVEALGNDMRNLLNSIVLTLDMIEKGKVGFGGATGSGLAGNLASMRHLIDHSLSELHA
jgi:hypothetical protein